jgi:hypothetical protein
MEVCDIPLNSWVDEVFLKVSDTEIDWRCGMDDVVKSILLPSEYLVKGTKWGNVLYYHKCDFAFPRRMKVQDLLSFGFGSYACSSLVTQLYRYRQ